MNGGVFFALLLLPALITWVLTTAYLNACRRRHKLTRPTNDLSGNLAGSINDDLSNTDNGNARINPDRSDSAVKVGSDDVNEDKGLDAVRLPLAHF